MLSPVVSLVDAVRCSDQSVKVMIYMSLQVANYCIEMTLSDRSYDNDTYINALYKFYIDCVFGDNSRICCSTCDNFWGYVNYLC